MKKTILFVLLLTGLFAHAQNFEGTITWSIKYDITDPAKKAAVEKGKQSLNDPANQAKIKQLQDKMNTPEMQSMMNANPQMKAQMETALKTLQGNTAAVTSDGGFIIKIKNNNSLVKMNMGGFTMETLYSGDKGQSYMLDRTAKTYSVLSADSAHRRPDSIQHKVTKTTETAIILGYNCTKYNVDLTDHGVTTHQAFWTTTEIKGLDLKALSKQRMGNNNQSLFYEGLTGVPLRIETATPQMNVIMEVTELKKETQSPDNFIIPSDFTLTKGFSRQK